MLNASAGPASPCWRAMSTQRVGPKPVHLIEASHCQPSDLWPSTHPALPAANRKTDRPEFRGPMRGKWQGPRSNNGKPTQEATPACMPRGAGPAHLHAEAMPIQRGGPTSDARLGAEARRFSATQEIGAMEPCNATHQLQAAPGPRGLGPKRAGGFFNHPGHLREHDAQALRAAGRDGARRHEPPIVHCARRGFNSCMSQAIISSAAMRGVPRHLAGTQRGDLSAQAAPGNHPPTTKHRARIMQTLGHQYTKTRRGTDTITQRFIVKAHRRMCSKQIRKGDNHEDQSTSRPRRHRRVIVMCLALP